MSFKNTVTHSLFMRIAEPRFFRVLQFFIYVCFAVTGTTVLLAPPENFQSIAGDALVYIFSAFVLLGSILGGIAVLPGIWWLERAGLLALGTGVAMFVVVVIALGASMMTVLLILVVLITFVQRWTEIRSAALAPRKE